MQRRRASSSQGVRQNDIHQLGMRHGYLLVLLLAAESWRQRFVPLPFHWVYLEHAFFQLIMPTLVPHKVINPNHGVHFHTCQGIIHHLASFYPLRWARQHFTLGDYCRMMQEYSLLNTGFLKKMWNFVFFCIPAALKIQSWICEAAPLVSKWFLLYPEISVAPESFPASVFRALWRLQRLWKNKVAKICQGESGQTQATRWRIETGAPRAYWKQNEMSGQICVHMITLVRAH